MHHWTDVEKTSARRIIVEMVRHSVTARAPCADSAQMETYKGRSPETSNVPPPPQQGAARSRLLTARLNLPTINIVQQISSVQTVEQELSAYLATEVAAGTDPLAFWHVSKFVFHFHGLQCILLGVPHHISDIISNRHGLPTDSSVFGPMRTSFLFRCRDDDQTPQQNQPDLNGSFADDKVFPQKGEVGLHGGLGHLRKTNATGYRRGRLTRKSCRRKSDESGSGTSCRRHYDCYCD